MCYHLNTVVALWCACSAVSQVTVSAQCHVFNDSTNRCHKHLDTHKGLKTSDIRITSYVRQLVTKRDVRQRNAVLVEDAAAAAGNTSITVDEDAASLSVLRETGIVRRKGLIL